MKKRITKCLSIIMCICICICFTPVFAFADEGTAGSESVGVSENTSQANETPGQASAPANQPSGSQISTDQSLSAQPSNGQDPNNQASAPAGEESVGENANAPGGAVTGNDAASTVENGADGTVTSNDNVTNRPSSEAVNAASTGDAEALDVAPRFTYLISVLFNGIKNADLISDDYSITFDAVRTVISDYLPVDSLSTSVQPASKSISTNEKLIFTKKNATVSYDNDHNTMLSWLFNTIQNENDNEIDYDIDFKSYVQKNYEIPGYQLTGSTTELNVKIAPKSVSSSDPDVEVLGQTDTPYSTFAVTNQYIKTASSDTTKDTTKDSSSDSSVTTSDASVQTGDSMNFSLLAILGLLALACGTATVLAARRQER